ncbi:uncharacterized protein KY384_004424 [Bacidia gigantensis]|uniref:uncharacterized protein n=1 Tax=Bacidia gigantensis TaxID=2732470 RepID=UPI001D054A88|nr:uncharacterized protein KY384_004424 [Bacidia gigantensis]KAG8531067.1 hypothetical protein KY384_004424 [Bacidia gigantensis]
MSLFGSGNNNQQGSGFGGFGSGNTNTGGFGSNNTTNTTSLFGAQNKPAFGSTTSGSGGGGLFGSGTATTGNSGGFGAFGSNNNNNQNTGGLFGSTTTSKPAFGGGSTGGGLFGSPNTGFGTTNNQSTGAFGSAPFGQGNATCEGTGSTPFSAYTEKEGTSNITNHYQSVSFMAPYKNWSFEELRLADYNGGRRHGNGSGQAGAFGSTNFGAFGQQNNTSGGFGQPTTTSAGGIFGNTTTQAPSGFGTQQTSSFGGNNNSSSTGLFGAPKPAGSGLFGSTTSAGTSGGLFGTAGGSGTSGTGFGSGGATNGLFGQQNNQQQNKGLFGSTGGGGFGSNTGFGSTNTQTGTNAFGSGTQNNSSPFGQSNNTQASNPFGAFTQPNQTQNQPQNQTQNQTSTSNPFGAFGAQNQEQKPGGIFGNPSTTNTNTGGGIFGPQTNNNQASGGLFGQSGTNQNSGSSLFGQKPATGGGLFGQANNNTANTGSGLFSGFSNQPQNQPQQSQGGGSSAPTTANKSLVGFSVAQIPILEEACSGPLIPQTISQAVVQQQTTGGGGLFGNNTNNNAGSSLFGSSQQQQQQPNPPNQFQPAQTLHTSIVDPNAFGSPSIFSGLPPPPQVSGPIATPISQKPKQKKSALLPYYKLTPNGASSRFQTPSKRGYGFSYSTYGTPGSASSNASTPGGLGGSLLYSSVGRGLGKSLSTSNLRGNYGDADSILTPGAFSANSSRYGGAGSMKKLTIDRSLRTDLFGDKGNSAALPSPEKERQSGILKKKVSFDASTVGGNGEQTNGVYVNGAVNGSSSNTAGPSTDDQGIPQTPRSQSKPKSNAAPQQLEMEQVRGNELAIVPEDEAPEAASAAPQRASVPKPQEDQEPGAYWMKPTKEQIQKMSKEQRSEISGFVVGRQGCGKVEFNKPVDLSNINLNDIFDNIVVIVVRTLTVYPETTQKPPLGKGLNVPSTLYLENSWPRQRDRVLPRYEKNGRHFDKHVERLRRVGDTTFVRYERDTGTWIFKVPHFTTYGFDYEDDTSDNESLHLNDSVMTEPPETPTPKSRTASGPTPKLPKASQHAPTKMKRAFQPDEAAEPINGRYLPGAFEDVALNDMDGLNVEMEEIDDEEFLSDERSAASPSESGGDEPSDIEITEGEINGQSVGVRDENQDLEMAGTFPELEKDQPDLGGEKAVLDVSGDWAYDLQQTIRPRKQDRQALRTAQTQQVKDKNVQTSSITDASARPAFATSIDLMNSLFGQSPPKGEKPFGSLGQKGVKV